METTYFTYHLYHRPTNMNYYGARWKKGCNPKDLFTTYFTSSKKVLKLIEEYGINSFDVKVRKLFDTKDDCIRWESKVLLRLGVPKNSKWLNVAIRMPTMYGRKHTKETLEKMQKPKGPWSKERKEAKSKEMKEKCKNGKNTLPNRTGIKHTEETKNKFKGRLAWNKGLHNPQAAENARKGADKVRQKSIGRKRKYRDDGSWFWDTSNVKLRSE